MYAVIAVLSLIMIVQYTRRRINKINKTVTRYIKNFFPGFTKFQEGYKIPVDIQEFQFKTSSKFFHWHSATKRSPPLRSNAILATASANLWKSTGVVDYHRRVETFQVSVQLSASFFCPVNRMILLYYQCINTMLRHSVFFHVISLFFYDVTPAPISYHLSSRSSYPTYSGRLGMPISSNARHLCLVF